MFLGGPPAAPVFMTVMGYFIALANKDIQTNMLRGIKLVAVGLILNIALNAHLLIKIYTGVYEIDSLAYIFGADIFFMAGISIMLISLLLKVFKDNVLPYFILILMVFLIQDYLSAPQIEGPMKYLMAFVFSDSWWSYFPIVPWLAYPLTGVIFYFLEKRFAILMKVRKAEIILFVVFCIVTIMSLPYGISVAADLPAYYHHSYQYYLFVLSFMIFWSLVINFLTRFERSVVIKFVQWIGINVTIIYVIQWIIIGNIATAIYKTQNIIQVIIWFPVILIFTLLVTFTFRYLLSKRSKTKTELRI